MSNIKFFGDFFSSCEIAELENKFLGIKYEKEEMLKTLENVDIERYMHNINQKDIMEVMFK
ncbi:lipoate protein ligase C-terminal domain-containing protein [Clostridium sp. BJN0013]|uniref:lipoate protein ligase C-terminal domain-containing protein n=1 Tax=Clostridium sp. BJN0013 TaxID=3236840 RepID=UPI0034C69018